MRGLLRVTGCFLLSVPVFAAELSPELQAEVAALKKHVEIGSVNKTSIRNDKDEKLEIVKIGTSQEEDSPFVGAMRFTFELTGKEDVINYGQMTLKQRPHPANYTGEDTWEFKIPHGALKMPKLTAYAIEFGFETNKVFVPVSEKFYKVESSKEILDRNKDPHARIKINGSSAPVREAAAAE